MVKLFDFKFLILLGLAVIIYLIYRELEQQRIKIRECENKIEILSKSQENNKVLQNEQPVLSTFELLSLRKAEALNEKALNEKTLGEQTLCEHVTKAYAMNKEQLQELQQEMILKKNKSQQIEELLEKNKEDNTFNYIDDLHLSLPTDILVENTSSSETSSKNSSVHLEVYSNDSNVESKSVFISEPNAVQQDIRLDSTKQLISDEQPIKLEQTNNDKQMEQTNKVEQVEQTNKVEQVEQTNNVEQVEQTNNVEQVEQTNNVEQVEQPKYTITSLLRMKISELQEIAKQRKVNIDKNIGGITKNKTKQELANDLIN